MLLHGIGEAGGESLITTDDALASAPSRRASLVLANPPFGKKSAITVVGTARPTGKTSPTTGPTSGRRRPTSS
ncbi:hypothetical protein ACISU4_01450 [Streptomyces wuyuanensis]|uniref:hypothetical protein n=1 Tax=Streptomyces wuyuanensis TaxID=1196353 RepID=UPI00382EAEFB